MLKKMTAISNDQITSQLNRILESAEFTSARRLQQFLRYVVGQYIQGRSERIKQYTIAVEGLGFGEDFNPQTNSIIRIQARRLRRAIDHYYYEQGQADPIRIQIPKGTYVPTIEVNRSAQTCDPIVPPDSGQINPATIAVLPFVCKGENQKEAYLAEALTEALTVGLTKFEGLDVIPSQSVEQFKGTQVSVGEIGNALNVRFILTGSMHKNGDVLRVSTQLMDAGDGVLLWAETMDRNISGSNIFATLDEVTRRILMIIGDEHGAILKRLIGAILDKPVTHLSPYETSQLYHQYNTTVGPHKHVRIRRALEQSVEMYPSHALGWSQLAAVCGDAYTLGYGGVESPLDKALFCAKKAISIDSRSQESRANLALVRFLNGHHQAAITEAEKAIPLNPNSAYVVSFSGWIIGLSGDLERGRQVIDEIDHFKPNVPGWLRLVPFIHHLEKAEFEHALVEARRFRMPDEIPWDPICRATAAGHRGKQGVAAAAYLELTEKFPEVARNPEDTIRIYLHFDHWVQTFMQGLEIAKAACTDTPASKKIRA